MGKSDSSIVTAPVLSLLCAVIQAGYGAISLLFACASFFTCGLLGKGVKSHLRDVGTAYLDSVAHLTDAAFSLFINAGDAFWSLKTTLSCGNAATESEVVSDADFGMRNRSGRVSKN